MDSIGIGLLGYGMIGRVHVLAYRELPSLYPGRLPPLRLAAVSASSPGSTRAAVEEGGFEAGFDDWAALVRHPSVQVVDCSLPNDLHAPALREALQAGKPVFCEKPLALDAAEARGIARLAEQTGVPVGMMFQYRFVPALMQARRLIESGELGPLYSFRVEYLHTGYQDPSRPMGWKMHRSRSGGGALVDLGSHVIDLVRWLMGDFDSVRALLHTWIRERPLRKGAPERGAVTVDDAAWLEIRLAGGALGTLEVSRFATGTLDDLRLQIHGERGALRFDLMDANWLYHYDVRRPGWTRLETVQDYPGAAVPPARSILGWNRTHAENQYRFLRAVADGKEPEPGLKDGVMTQLVLEAAYASAESGGWVAVPRQ